MDHQGEDLVVNKESNNILVEQLMKHKDEGTKLFKEQNIVEAIKSFNQGALLYETQTEKVDQRAQTLYVQLLTNQCLCLSSLSAHEEVLLLSNKVLQLDRNNLKAHYRRATSLVSIVEAKESQPQDTLEFMEEVNQLLEMARKDLEKISYMDKGNKLAVDKLKEVQHKNIKYRLMINELRPQKELKIETKQEEQLLTKNTIQQSKNGRITENLTRQQLDQISSNVSQTLISQLLENPQLESCSMFEQNMKLFKNERQLVDYVSQIDREVFANLYRNKELQFEIFMQIINAVHAQVRVDQAEQVLAIIQLLPLTKKFDFSLMCMTKKEKNLINETIQLLQVDEQQLTLIKKTYKL